MSVPGWGLLMLEEKRPFSWFSSCSTDTYWLQLVFGVKDFHNEAEGNISYARMHRISSVRNRRRLPSIVAIRVSAARGSSSESLKFCLVNTTRSQRPEETGREVNSVANLIRTCAFMRNWFGWEGKAATCWRERERETIEFPATYYFCFPRYIKSSLGLCSNT